MKSKTLTYPFLAIFLFCYSYISYSQGNIFYTTTNYNITGGDRNVVIGQNAGAAMTGSGVFYNYQNTFLGFNAGRTSAPGVLSNFQNAYNTYVGAGSGFGSSTTTGSYNSFLGYNTGLNITTGTRNTVLGAEAGTYLTTGSYNVLAGEQSGYSNSSNYLTGSYNTTLGYQSGFSLTSGAYNILIGNQTGYASAVSGSYNSVLGYQAGYNLSSAQSNILLGRNSGYNLTTSSENLFIGNYAGFNQTTVATANNTFIGGYSGYTNDTGISNTFIGFATGYNNSTSSNNAYLGSYAGYNTTGGNNTAIGSNTGNAVETGTYNTSIGSGAGSYNRGDFNVSVGASAGRGGSFLSSAGLTYGDYDVYVGFSAGNKSRGANNVMLGAFSGQDVTTGGGNVCIGSYAGQYLTTSSSNVYLGSYSYPDGANRATLTNTTAIGSSSRAVRSNTMILGDTINNIQVGIGTAWPTQKLTVKGNFAFVAYNDGLFYQNNRFLFQDEKESIALGTGHEDTLEGKGNLLLGANTKNEKSINYSTAIGYGASVSVENGLVLGNTEVKVGIGTSNPTARLEVASGKENESGLLFSNLKQSNVSKFLTVDAKGRVILEKPRTQISKPEDWSDKVFEQNYQLKSLTEVERFIKANKHLPNLPSAQEMTEKGIENDKLAAKLLEKIEELTLYMIELKKENQELKNQNEFIKMKVNELQTISNKK
ncbi:MAG: hypothetical protein MUF58_00540 [Arcicella sp.]|jgi:hypothetical protein|nr:hypothetical protein [Arcicella sp.]